MEDFNSRIGRTVKAYQGNPKALDKKYQMNKELADLIGLQTILSQQEAISRETMLRENQQVGNLREQYEQKLASNSQDGMAKRIAGVMGAPPKQNQQPPMPQGIAGQAPPQQGQRPPMPQGQRPSMPQGQRPPMGAGIAGQPRPNMRMAAQGGIIGYVGGGTTSTDEETPLTAEELEAARIAQETSRETMQGAGGEAAARVAEAKVKRERLQAEAAARNTGSIPAQASVLTPAQKEAAEKARLAAAEKARLAAAEKARLAAAAKYSGDPTGVAQFMESIGEIGLSKEDFDLSTIERGQVPEKTNQQKGLRAIQEANALTSPTQMAEAERKRLDARYGITDRKAEITDEIELQKARDKSQMNPDSIAKEEKNAILRGMALGGVRGSTIAQDRLKSNISKNKQANMDRIISMTKNRHAETFNALSKVDDQAATVWKDYSEQADRAMTIIATMDANDVAAVEERYKNDVLAKSSQLGNVVAAAQAANELTLLKMQRETQSRAALNKIMKDARDSSIEIRNSFNENPLYKQAIREAQSTIQQATTDDPPSTQELTEAKNVMRDHQALIEKALDDALISQTIENASAKLIEIG